jgi:hypothetical protein
MGSRVNGMALHTERVARKRHRCAWDCGTPIEPGTRYVRCTAPPNTEENTSPHWWTATLHGASLYDCPTYAGSHEADPRVEASSR